MIPSTQPMQEKTTQTVYSAAINSKKPTVNYLRSQMFILPRGTREGDTVYTAELYAIKHPRLGSGIVRTSQIIFFSPASGVIETLNTLYVPVDRAE